MRIRTAVIGLCAAAVATTVVVAGPGAASGGPGNGPADAAIKAVGLGTNGTTLVSFSIGFPQKTKSVQVGTLSGADTSLIGIDYRVQDGKLYGVGNGGGIYAVDPATGKATFVQALTVALSGTSFGVDFNPAANALRIVSNTGQNLRQPLAVANTPTATDTALTGGTGVVAAAYTNNDLSPATATSLFDISETTDQVLLQSPANSGTLAATGTLGVDTSAVVGFDIFSDLDDQGITKDNRAFAILTTDTGSGLYEISLLTGKARPIGDTLRTPLSDIAVGLDG